jgi:TolB-like protein/predicted Ser/Thr protein kinase
MPTLDIQKIGRYENLTLLGQGGMGAVYRGRDPELERQVAIKVMLDATPDFVARFRREAQAIARLTHANIVQVYDFGVDGDGNPYFVMELVDGVPLDKILRDRGRLPAADAVRLARQAAEGLAAAHRAGIVHRDIKPSNLIIDPRGAVKLVDFGIARVQAGSGPQLTNAAALMGTPGYMAPEQAMGRPVDHRADIYALGLTLFEMLAGRAPFEADDAISLVVKNMQEPLPSVTLRAGGIPDELVRLVEQMGAKDPDERLQSADAVIAALDAIAPSLGGATQDVARADTDRIPPTNVHAKREEVAVAAAASGGGGAPARRGLGAVVAIAGVGAAAMAIGVVLLVHKPATQPTMPPTAIGHGAGNGGGTVGDVVNSGNGKPVVQNDVTVGQKPTTGTTDPKLAGDPKPNDSNPAHSSGTGTLGGPLRVGILSFKPLAGDADSKQLADGVAETTPDTFFTKHRDLREHVRVVERASVDGAIGELDLAGDFHWDKDAVMKAGHQKGAQVLVVGGVQKAAGKYRVSARFVRVEDGEVLDTFLITSRAKDPFKAQDELAEGLAEKLYSLAETWKK